MGRDAGAKLGWGYILGYRDEDEVYPDGFDSHEWNDTRRLELFGFTEPRPPATWLEVEDPDEKQAAREAFLTEIKLWEARRDTAAPVELVNFSYEYSGQALMLTRRAWTYDYQGKTVPPAVVAPPKDGELQALRTAFKDIFRRYPDGDPELLLLPEYG